MVMTYLNRKDAIIMGHLKQTRQGLRATQAPQPIIQEQFPPPSNSISSNEVFLKVQNLEVKIFTGQTVRFHVTSSKGNIHPSGISLRLQHHPRHTAQN